MNSFFIRLGILALALSLVTMPVAAQSSCPTRAIRLVTPLPVGASFDAVSRKVAESLAGKLRVTVVVENKPGANGAIAAAEVARVAPDGYMLLITISDPLISTPATQRVPYDPERAFTPVGKIALSAPVLIANSNCTNVLSDLIAESRQKQDSSCSYYGSAGNGSFPQLVMESINRQANAKFREVAYKGPSSAIQDVLANQIGMTFMGGSQVAQLAASGRVKPVAVMGLTRSRLLPDVPTFAEIGYDNFAVRRLSWLGLVGPAGLPREVIAKLSEAVRSVVTDPQMVEWMNDQDFEPNGNSTPERFEQELKAERTSVVRFIRDELKIQSK